MLLREFALTSNGDDSSGYVNSITSIIKGMYFVAGFTFTVVALLLTLLKDPTSMFFQVILFLLNTLLDLSIFLAAWYAIHLSTIFPYAPHITRGLNAATFLTFIVAALTTLITTLLFFLFGMVYLGLVSSIEWVVLDISAYYFIMKPAQQFDNEMKKREQRK